MKYVTRFSHIALQLALFFTCYVSQQKQENGNQKNNCDQLSPGQKGFIQLTNNDEPGEPLFVYGRVIDEKTNQPLSNASIFLYQTDNKGIYSNSRRDEDARIRGTVYTNESGCFKIKTILPGDYPGQKNSRHLHYVIKSNGYAEKKSIIFFKGFTTSNITEEGPLIVMDIRKDAKGVWTGSADLSISQSR